MKTISFLVLISTFLNTAPAEEIKGSIAPMACPYSYTFFNPAQPQVNSPTHLNSVPAGISWPGPIYLAPGIPIRDYYFYGPGFCYSPCSNPLIFGGLRIKIRL